MHLAPAVLLYIVVRIAFGAWFAAREWTERESGFVAAADLAAEGCALLFLLGAADPRVRTAVGGWWFLLFVYAMVREAVRVYSWSEQTVEATGASDAETLAAPLVWLWEIVGVLPPILIGGYLAGTSL